LARYPLEGLLTIRRLRDEAAARAVRQAKTDLAAARAREKEQQKSLAEFRSYKEAEIERRYSRILGQKLSLAELDSFRAGLGELNQMQLQKEEILARLVQAAQSQEQKLFEAQKAAKKAAAGLQKIESQKEHWRVGELARMEQAEASELEEFPGRPQMS
jgi:hypothetical protein